MVNNFDPKSHLPFCEFSRYSELGTSPPQRNLLLHLTTADFSPTEWGSSGLVVGRQKGVAAMSVVAGKTRRRRVVRRWNLEQAGNRRKRGELSPLRCGLAHTATLLGPPNGRRKGEVLAGTTNRENRNERRYRGCFSQIFSINEPTSVTHSDVAGIASPEVRKNRERESRFSSEFQGKFSGRRTRGKGLILNSIFSPHSLSTYATSRTPHALSDYHHHSSPEIGRRIKEERKYLQGAVVVVCYALKP